MLESQRILKYFAVAMLVIGLFILLHAGYLAILFFNTYTIQSIPSSIESALSKTISYILDIVIRIAFLGLYIWIGTILLSRGIESLKASRA